MRHLTTPRARWHLLHYGPAVLLAVLVVPVLLADHAWLAAWCVTGAAATLWVGASGSRRWYKAGWTDGQVDLVREMTHDPDYHRGTGAPEPWMPRPLITVGVHHHHRPDDAPTDGA